MSNAVALKLPTFWYSQPEVWFAQAEAQFALRNITVDATKYFYIVAALDQDAATRLLDLITNPLPYQAISSNLAIHDPSTPATFFSVYIPTSAPSFRPPLRNTELFLFLSLATCNRQSSCLSVEMRTVHHSNVPMKARSKLFAPAARLSKWILVAGQKLYRSTVSSLPIRILGSR